MGHQTRFAEEKSNRVRHNEVLVDPPDYFRPVHGIGRTSLAANCARRAIRKASSYLDVSCRGSLTASSRAMPGISGRRYRLAQNIYCRGYGTRTTTAPRRAVWGEAGCQQPPLISRVTVKRLYLPSAAFN
jgi:hypothetical protein